MRRCSIEECDNKHFGKGYCSKHYTRLRRNGDPNIVQYERHGYRFHRLYPMWQHMKARCYNKNNRGYKHYGGRGIIVCNEWINNPPHFIEWVLKNGWKEGLEIDRENNDGNYSPENCRFVTHKENIHNQRLLQSNNTSGYRGVTYYRNYEKWLAQICINGKSKNLGYFNSPIDAAVAYDKAVPDNRPRNFS